jgi:hypothetical protein
LPHGGAGACALILAPMQFWDRLRVRFTTLHRITGSIYVACAFVLAPLGVYIQYLDEAQGASRSFTIATVIDAALLMITTVIALIFALKRMNGVPRSGRIHWPRTAGELQRKAVRARPVCAPVPVRRPRAPVWPRGGADDPATCTHHPRAKRGRQHVIRPRLGAFDGAARRMFQGEAPSLRRWRRAGRVRPC